MTVFLILNIWTKSYTYNCLALFFPLILLLLISYSFVELKVHERLCFKNCYFASNSLFAKMLSSRFFVILFYLFASVLMTLSALFVLIDFKTALWTYLFFHILVATLLYRYLTKEFQHTVKPSYRALFAREWTINITAIIFVLVYIYFLINDYEPTYIHHTLEETWRDASNSISSDCLIVNYFLKLQKELDGIFWWLIDKGTETIQNKTLNLFIWIGFLFMNSFALLGINRFIAQIIYLLDKIFQKRDTA